MGRKKPPRIARKNAGRAKTLREKFYWSQDGTSTGKEPASDMWKLYIMSRGIADPSVARSFRRAAAQFGEKAAHAITSLDMAFFATCCDTIARLKDEWSKEDGPSPVDELGSRVLTHLLRLARQKHAASGPGQVIKMGELMEELRSHFPGPEKKGLYSGKNVRDALYGLKLGLCPLPADFFVEQYDLMMREEREKLKA